MDSLRNRFKVVIVTGIPGVGKTTVLSLAVKKSSEKGLKVKVVNFGSFMLETAIKEGLVNNRDEIRYLGMRKQLELQQMAARKIVEESEEELGEKDVLVVDTHAIVKTPLGYLPGLPKHVLDELKPDIIAVVEANPNDVYSRQTRDKMRMRSDFGDVRDIEKLMSYAREASFASAVHYASPVVVILNEENKIEEAADKITNILLML